MKSGKSVEGTGIIKGGEYCAMVEHIQKVDASFPVNLLLLRSYSNVKNG